MQRASEGVCEMDSVQCSREHEGKNIIPLYRLKSVSHLKKPMIILRRKKDGDWYIYPQLLAHKNLNNVRKSIQETYKIFKPGLHNVLSTGTNIVRIGLSLCLMGCVSFARYCGKMYSGHLFSYGGLCLCLGHKMNIHKHKFLSCLEVEIISFIEIAFLG